MSEYVRLATEETDPGWSRLLARVVNSPTFPLDIAQRAGFVERAIAAGSYDRLSDDDRRVVNESLPPMVGEHVRMAAGDFDESKVTRDKGQFSEHAGDGPAPVKYEDLVSEGTLDRVMPFATDQAVDALNAAAQTTAEQLSSNEVEAVQGYTAGRSYSLNEVLLDGGSLDTGLPEPNANISVATQLSDAQIDDALHSAVANQSEVEPPSKVYRGISEPEGATGTPEMVANELAIGAEGTFKSWQSTSINSSMAAEFASRPDHGNDVVLLEITPARGKGVAIGESLSINGHENEYLLEPGSRYRVTGHSAVSVEGESWVNDDDEEEIEYRTVRVVRVQQLPDDVVASGFDESKVTRDKGQFSSHAGDIAVLEPGLHEAVHYGDVEGTLNDPDVTNADITVDAVGPDGDRGLDASRRSCHAIHD